MKLFPVWLFFYLAFSLLRFTQNTAISAEGYQPTVPSLVLVGSLIVAKAFLVMDVFKLMNRYDERPLFYSVLWKSGIYGVGSLVVFYIEQFVELLVKHHPFSQAQGELLARMGSARFGVIAI